MFASSLGVGTSLLAASGVSGFAQVAHSGEAAGPDRLADELHAAIATFPVDDTHCHALTDHDAQTTPENFLERIALSAMPAASYFPPGVLSQWRTGGTDVRARLDRQYGIEKLLAEIRFHIRESIFVKYLTKDLAQFLGCAPRLETVIAARNERCRDYPRYIADLFADVKLANAMVDTGFAEGMDAKGFQAFAQAIQPCRMRALARVETIQTP
ncbi:MAG: amidohydrolase 2, partial [Bryobacterales bacterium]|nr:amidohydrolase 2 [Bryobacterales bacterium]